MNIKLFSTFIATILAVATPAMGAVAGPHKPLRGFGKLNGPLPGHRKIPLLPLPPILIPVHIPIPALIRGGKKKPPTTPEGNTPPADAPPVDAPPADAPPADAPPADAPPTNPAADAPPAAT